MALLYRQAALATLSQVTRGGRQIAIAAGLLLGVAVGSPALAAPDFDGAADALVSTPLDPAGDLLGAAGLLAAGGFGLAGDALALVDRNAYGELVLRGVLSTSLRRTALALSHMSTGALEGLRAEDLERFPEPAASYRDGGGPGERLDTAAAGLGAAGLALLDAAINPLLCFTRGVGLEGPAGALATYQTDARSAWLGTAK